MNIPISRRTVCAAALGALGTPFSIAQERYPSHAVRFLVPFSAGSLMDVLTRLFAEKLSRRLEQPFLIDNRPGAGGIAASRALLAMPPDGYQALCISSGHSVNPLMQALPYDTARDFSGLALMATSPSIAVVNVDHPAKDLRQLLEMARRRPEGVAFGSAGVASGTHLAGEYLALEAGVKFLHVPFKGAQEAVTEVLAGRLDVAFPAMGVVVPQVKAGKLRALGVTSAKRVPQLPDVPTFIEGGMPNFDHSITFGTVVSSKTPRDHMRLLASHMTAVSQMPEVQQQLDALGLIPGTETLERFDEYLALEAKMLARIIRGAKLS